MKTALPEFHIFAPEMAKKNSFSPNLILILAILSVILCWMYGIVGLALGIVSLVKNIQFQRNKNPKGKAATKLQWAKVLSIAGMFVSILFITYYILVFSYGTFIRF